MRSSTTSALASGAVKANVSAKQVMVSASRGNKLGVIAILESDSSSSLNMAEFAKERNPPLTPPCKGGGLLCD